LKLTRVESKNVVFENSKRKFLKGFSVNKIALKKFIKKPNIEFDVKYRGEIEDLEYLQTLH